MRFQETISIRRPLDEVFAYVTDPSNLPEWDDGIRRARMTTPEPMDVGTEVEIERTVPPFNRTARFVGQVEDFEPPRRFSIAVDDGPIPYAVTYAFQGHQGETTMNVSIESQPHGLLKILDPLTSRLVRKQVRGYYQQLRRILETRDAPDGRRQTFKRSADS